MRNSRKITRHSNASQKFGEIMKKFHFRAAALVDALANATVKDLQAMHEAPGTAEYCAKTKRFAFWLTSELTNKGIVVNGPDMDEGGWYISIAPSRVGFVLCIVSGSGDDASQVELLVTNIGEGTENDVVCNTIENILRHASQITDLKVV